MSLGGWFQATLSYQNHGHSNSLHKMPRWDWGAGSAGKSVDYAKQEDMSSNFQHTRGENLGMAILTCNFNARDWEGGLLRHAGSQLSSRLWETLSQRNKVRNRKPVGFIWSLLTIGIHTLKCVQMWYNTLLWHTPYTHTHLQNKQIECIVFAHISCSIGDI